MADAGRVWAALSAAHQQTGLVPFLLEGLYGDTNRPWDQEEFDHPADPAELGHLDAATVLTQMWDGEMPSAEEDEEEDEPWTAMRAPVSKQFPGLAPPGGTSLSREQLGKVLGSLPPKRIGLVPATRPADVLPLIRPADRRRNLRLRSRLLLRLHGQSETASHSYRYRGE